MKKAKEIELSEVAMQFFEDHYETENQPLQTNGKKISLTTEEIKLLWFYFRTLNPISINNFGRPLVPYVKKSIGRAPPSGFTENTIPPNLKEDQKSSLREIARGFIRLTDNSVDMYSDALYIETPKGGLIIRKDPTSIHKFDLIDVIPSPDGISELRFYNILKK